MNVSLAELYDLAPIIHHTFPVSSGREGLAVLTAVT